jgi:hypothetical protein
VLAPDFAHFSPRIHGQAVVTEQISLISPYPKTGEVIRREAMKAAFNRCYSH